MYLMFVIQVNGDWSEWSSWNPCSATCNGGIQDRIRQCNAPQPSNGGLYCNGTTIISRPCNNIFCESKFVACTLLNQVPYS